MPKPQPIPVGDELVTKARSVTDAWVKWLTWLVGLVMRAPSVQSPVISLSDQSASIATSSLPLVQYSGIYRICQFIHVTQAATTSSSIQLDVTFTSDGTALTFTYPAVTGNTTGTFASGNLLEVYIDGGTTPTYSVTYASVGATPAKYRLCVTMEQVSA